MNWTISNAEYVFLFKLAKKINKNDDKNAQKNSNAPCCNDIPMHYRIMDVSVYRFTAFFTCLPFLGPKTVKSGKYIFWKFYAVYRLFYRF